MSDCERTQELINKYLDGELTQAERAELEGHCALCPDCSELLAVLSEVSDLMSEDAEPPETLRRGVMDAVRELNAEKKQKKPKTVYIRWAGIAASLALVSFAAIRLIPAFQPAGNTAPMMVKSADNSVAESYLDVDSAADEGYYPDENSLGASFFMMPADTDINSALLEGGAEAEEAPEAAAAQYDTAAPTEPSAANGILESAKAEISTYLVYVSADDLDAVTELCAGYGETLDYDPGLGALTVNVPFEQEEAFLAAVDNSGLVGGYELWG